MTKELVVSLTKTFCTAFKLYYTTHSAHWNVEGINFYELHKMLEGQYEEIYLSIDDLAEKIRQLDAYAPSSLAFVLQIGENFEDCSKFEPFAMLSSLVNSQETMIKTLNATLTEAKKANHEDLVNYLGGRLEAHSKMRWMLRASAKRFGESEKENLEVTAKEASSPRPHNKTQNRNKSKLAKFKPSSFVY